MNNGAVSASILYGASRPLWYNAETAAQYIPVARTYGHRVTIVGWDDNYAVENFAIQPEGPGAWIIKDSYGTSEDELYPIDSGYQGTGYYYVSYYDQTLEQTQQLIAGDESDDIIQQYDLLGTSPFADAVMTDEAAQVANVFTAEQDMSLDATTVSTVTRDADVTVSVYLLPEDADATADGFDPTSGELLARDTASYGTAGRFRFEFEGDPIEIPEGRTFSIVEEIREDSVDDAGAMQQLYYLPLEGGTSEAYAGENGFTFVWNAKINEGETFVKVGDGAWGDAAAINDNAELTNNGSYEFGNALIKAYGTPIEIEPEPEPEPEPETFTVTLDTFDGTPDTLTVTEGETLKRPADPTRDGYTFLGWYTTYDRENNTLSDPYDFSQSVTGSLTLYAGWKANEGAEPVNPADPSEPTTPNTPDVDNTGEPVDTAGADGDGLAPTGDAALATVATFSVMSAAALFVGTRAYRRRS